MTFGAQINDQNPEGSWVFTEIQKTFDKGFREICKATSLSAGRQLVYAGDHGIRGGERGSECAAYTFSKHLQSFLQYLQAPERADEEVGTEAWVVLPVQCTMPALSATSAVLRSSTLIFLVRVEQAALAVQYILLSDGWMDPGMHNR